MALESDAMEFRAARNEKLAEVGEAGFELLRKEKIDDVGEASEAKVPFVGDTAVEAIEEEDEVREWWGFEARFVGGRLGSSFGVVEVRIMSLLEQFLLWLKARRTERRRWGIWAGAALMVDMFAILRGCVFVLLVKRSRLEVEVFSFVLLSLSRKW